MAPKAPEIDRQDQCVARRQVLRLFGAGFSITALDGRVFAASEQAAFHLKADIRDFDDANETDNPFPGCGSKLPHPGGLRSPITRPS